MREPNEPRRESTMHGGRPMDNPHHAPVRPEDMPPHRPPVRPEDMPPHRPPMEPAHTPPHRAPHEPAHAPHRP